MKLYFLFSLISLPLIASVQVSWRMPDPLDEVRKIDGTTPLDSNSVWQLIWTPDAAISDYNINNPFIPDASEVLLLEFDNPDGSFIFPAQTFDDAGDTYVGGYVYTRAFDYVGSTSSSNPFDYDGLWYVESTLSTALEKIDGVPPGNPTLHEPFAVAAVTVVNQQFNAIPEPSTLMLLGMSLFGIYQYRKYRRS